MPESNNARENSLVCNVPEKRQPAMARVPATNLGVRDSGLSVGPRRLRLGVDTAFAGSLKPRELEPEFRKPLEAVK